MEMSGGGGEMSGKIEMTRLVETNAALNPGYNTNNDTSSSSSASDASLRRRANANQVSSIEDHTAFEMIAEVNFKIWNY